MLLNDIENWLEVLQLQLSQIYAKLQTTNVEFTTQQQYWTAEKLKIMICDESEGDFMMRHEFLYIRR